MTESRPVIFALFVLLLLQPAAASATDLMIGSRTYVTARETEDSEDHLTVYEYLDGDLYPSEEEGFSFHAGGWWRLDLRDDTHQKGSNGELLYGRLGYKAGTGDFVVDFGRIYVLEGVAAVEQIDGLVTRMSTEGGIRAAAFAGIPVETDDIDRDDDRIYGGRLSFGGYAGNYQLGISYLDEENDGEEYREEGGVDIYGSLGGLLAVQGGSSYNFIRDAWMIHDYRFSLSTPYPLSINGNITWAGYEEFFWSSDSSAFDHPGSEEEVLILGSEIFYHPAESVAVGAGYTRYDYDLAEGADSWSLRADYNGESAGGGISLRRMEGDTDDLSYWESRGYIFRMLGPADITLDLHNASYDEKINDLRNAYSISLCAGYDLAEGMRIAADVGYGRNPDYDKQWEGFLKFLWEFETSLAAEGGAK